MNSFTFSRAPKNFDVHTQSIPFCKEGSAPL
jgi:hypothetical protein